MTDLTERLKHFEDNQRSAGDEYGAEVLWRARRRIEKLEAERDEARAERDEAKERVHQLEADLIGRDHHGADKTAKLLAVLREYWNVKPYATIDEATIIVVHDGTWYTLHDNGGEINVHQINGPLLRSIPATDGTVGTLAYRIAVTIAGREIDWDNTDGDMIEATEIVSFVR